MARGFRPIQHTKFLVPSIERTIQVSYRHQVHFTEGVFQPSNPLLRDIMIEGATRQRHKAIVVVDEALSQSQPFLVRSIENYFASHRELQLVCAPIIRAATQFPSDSQRRFTLHANKRQRVHSFKGMICVVVFT